MLRERNAHPALAALGVVNCCLRHLLRGVDAKHRPCLAQSSYGDARKRDRLSCRKPGPFMAPRRKPSFRRPASLNSAPGLVLRSALSAPSRYSDAPIGPEWAPGACKGAAVRPEQESNFLCRFPPCWIIATASRLSRAAGREHTVEGAGVDGCSADRNWRRAIYACTMLNDPIGWRRHHDERE